MKTRFAFLLIFLMVQVGLMKSLAVKPPLVYLVENTGAKFKKPVMLTLDQLPVVNQLTDPFVGSTSKKRSTKFKDWSRRRAEIAWEIQHYEIGKKTAPS
jgi:hypothetical protein